MPVRALRRLRARIKENFAKSHAKRFAKQITELLFWEPEKSTKLKANTLRFVKIADKKHVVCFLYHLEAASFVITLNTIIDYKFLNSLKEKERLKIFESIAEVLKRKNISMNELFENIELYSSDPKMREFLQNFVKSGFMDFLIERKFRLFAESPTSEYPLKKYALGLLLAGATERQVKAFTGIRVDKRQILKEEFERALEIKYKKGSELEKAKILLDFVLANPVAERIKLNNAEYVVCFGRDAHESEIGFGIVVSEIESDLLPIKVNFYHANGFMRPLGRLKLAVGFISFTPKERKPVLLIEAIQGAKETLSRAPIKQYLDVFSNSVGMPWPVYLGKKLKELARQQGFYGIGIVTPKFQEFIQLHAKEGDLEIVKRASGMLVSTAKKLGLRQKVTIKGKQYFFAKL